MSQDHLAALPSQARPQQNAPGLFYTWFHGNCRRCNHWHDGTRKLLSKDSTKHVSISCDRCQNKIFGLGRRETHTSLLSQETIHSITRDSHAARSAACTNDAWDEISPRQSASLFRPLDLGPGSAEQPSEQTDGGEPTQEPFDIGQSVQTTTPEKTDTVEKPDFLVSTSLESPPKESSSVQLSPVAVDSPPRPSRRVKYFNRVTKSVGRLLGLDVQIQASKIDSRTSSGFSLDPPDGSVPRFDDGNAANASDRAIPLQADTSAETRLRPRKRSAADAVSESATLRNSMKVDEPDNNADEEEMVQRRKRDSRRLFNINKIRNERTNSARVVYCRCDSQCDCCKLSSASGIPTDTASIDLPLPSLGSDSRTNSDMTDASLSGGSPAPSVRQSALLRNAGAGFEAVAAAAMLAARRTRHMSATSRPSRLSSVVNSEASSESRPGSAAGPALSVLPHSSPLIPVGVVEARRRVSLEHMEQLPRLMLNTRIAEEPRSEQDRNSATSLTPRPRSLSESNESVTPTQESVDVDEEFRRSARQGRHKSTPSGSGL